MQDLSYLVEDYSGVYLLYQDDVCIYVGQSRKVIKRIFAHVVNPRMVFNRVLVEACSEDKLDETEFKLIREYQPTKNKTMAGKPMDRVIDLAALGLPIRTTKAV